jgi:eukaryotic-like serine/threonine-protein kinase
MSGEVTAGPWQLADELVLAQVEARVLGVHRQVTIGRYRIQRDLGAGGMGQVVLAFDPTLERNVALKLIAPARTRSAEARQRIVAEARAMAQLSDPHVAQVYEVDEIDGRLFVAIEYVDGEDLRAWLASAPRSWREIAEIFLQAGRGLVAAHAKGIIHRDFKPDNVVLDRDGRARVVDFGLASAAAVAPTEAAVDEDRSWRGVPGITRTGDRVGTPDYMAPEQWDGGHVDAASDQFAFCVATFEAIAGRSPFVAEADAPRPAHRLGVQAPWPRSAPRWLYRALLRGLQVDPAARWPDMSALLRAIDPVRRRRRIVSATMVIGVAALSAITIVAAHDPCRDADAPVVALWGDEQRAAVIAAATAADPTWGERSGQQLAARLDGYAASWSTAARAACSVASDGDRRVQTTTGCLAHGRRRFADTIDEAVGQAPAQWVSAVARAELLPDAASCADAPALSAYATSADAPAPDAEVATVASIAAAEKHLGEMIVRGEPTVYTTAIARGREAAEVAIATAEAAQHEPLLARALLVAARLELGEGDPSRTEAMLRRASAVAQRCGDAPTAAAIAVELVYAISRERERFREADDLASEAAGMIAALGDPPLLRARLAAHRASAIAHAAEADHAAAVELHRAAASLVRETLGDAHPATIVAEGNIGAALNYAERPREAEQTLLGALATAERSWGEEHPRTALLIGTLGLARMRLGELDAAEHDLRRSLRVREATLGRDHPQVDDARFNLASVLRRRGEHAEAAALLRVGLDDVRRRLGSDDSRLGPWCVAAGESLREIGDHDGARVHLAEALRLFERGGATARDYARVRFGLARAWADADVARAGEFAEQARIDAAEAGATKLVAEIDGWLASR